MVLVIFWIGFVIVAIQSVYRYQVPWWIAVLLSLVISVVLVVFHIQMKRTSKKEKQIDRSLIILIAVGSIARLTAKVMDQQCRGRTYSETQLETKQILRDMLYHIRIAIERINPKAAGSDQKEHPTEPRIVIFRPSEEDPNYLVPLCHMGHTNIEHMPPKEIREDSNFTAVKTWVTKEDQFIGNVFDRESSWEQLTNKRNYYSIACVLIKANEQPLGVLSLTGKDKNAYNGEGEKKYLKVLADALAPSLHFYVYSLPKIFEKQTEGMHDAGHRG